MAIVGDEGEAYRAPVGRLTDRPAGRTDGHVVWNDGDYDGDGGEPWDICSLKSIVSGETRRQI